MDKQDQQTIDALQKEVAQLKRLVLSLSVRVQKLEKDNIRIKHDARGTKMNLQALGSRAGG